VLDVDGDGVAVKVGVEVHAKTEVGIGMRVGMGGEKDCARLWRRRTGVCTAAAAGVRRVPPSPLAVHAIVARIHL
jgi:hypothetical protein